MVWKQKACIGFVWALVTLLIVALIYSQPPVYKAETLILVDSQKIPEKYVTATVNSDIQDRLDTITQQILSSTRLEKIIIDFDLYRKERNRLAPEEVIEIMRRDTKVTIERTWGGSRPSAFRISYQGINPVVVAGVANRLANFYIEENLRSREVQAEGATEFLENQLQQAKKVLDEQEDQVSRYKLAHSGELPQQENSLSAALTRLRIELQGNQDALNRAQQNKLMLESALSIAESSQLALARAAEPGASGIPAAVAATSPTGQPREKPPKNSKQLEVELNVLLLRYKTDHPEVRRLQADIARMRHEEEKELAEHDRLPPASQGSVGSKAAPETKLIVAGVTPELVRERGRMADLRSQIGLANREIEFRNTEQRRILREIASIEQKVEKLPIREQEMASVTRDYETSKANYKSLLDKKFAAEMAADLERRKKGERFIVLDPAHVPQKPFNSRRRLLSALGCVVGLAIAMAFGVGRELKKNTLLGEWELPPDTPVLARVPCFELAPLDSEILVVGARKPKKRWRMALIASALLSLLGALALGLYFAQGRF